MRETSCICVSALIQFVEAKWGNSTAELPGRPRRNRHEMRLTTTLPSRYKRSSNTARPHGKPGAPLRLATRETSSYSIFPAQRFWGAQQEKSTQNGGGEIGIFSATQYSYGREKKVRGAQLPRNARQLQDHEAFVRDLSTAEAERLRSQTEFQTETDRVRTGLSGSGVPYVRRCAGRKLFLEQPPLNPAKTKSR